MDDLNLTIKNCQQKYKQEGPWIYFNTGEKLPQQGWKIHISTQIKDSISIFSICQKALYDKKIYFKVAKDTDTLKRINSPRETSPTANKFITVYTQDSDQARQIILELVSLLNDFKSPKILTDFQCGNNSPVHYRYGAFKELRSYNPKTKKIMYMLENNKGEFVEDLRESYFSIPYWKKDLFNDDEKKLYFKVNDVIPEKSVINDYTFEKILKKSNRGNVYQAIHKKSNQKVLVKQTRPFVSDDLEGKRYAIDDLKNESRMLKCFSNKNYTSTFIDEFEINGDNFLVQGFIDGLNYYDLVQENISLELKVKIIDNIVDIINDLHFSGYKLVDLSPSNFIYRLDGSVFLVDLESVSHTANSERLVKTPFMVNPDEDLNQSSIQQDYFALALISFALLTGQVLTFSKGDRVYKIDSTEKIIQSLRISEKNSVIDSKHVQWLIYLLSLSSKTENIDVGNIPKILNYKANINYENFFDVNKVDYENEAKKVIKFLHSQKIDKNGRIAKSSEFGEFVNPLSFQHGMSGYIKFFTQVGQLSDLNHFKKWIKYIESNRIESKYLYEKSLLFGESGYLWSIIDLYIKTQDKYYASIIREIAHRLVRDFEFSQEIDFALGLSGVIHALIKYTIYFKDLEIEYFIKNNISKLANHICKSTTKSDLNHLEYSFAHGLSGIAYTLFCYSRVFNDNSYYTEIEHFNKQIVMFLERFCHDHDKRYNNLELSWCEGMSGIILYLCLVDSSKYSTLIKRAQDKVNDDCFAMGTSYCHGLSSLIQTYQYVNRDFNDLKILLISKSYRKHNLLVFQSENRHEDYFDFGIGTLGIYWVLLNHPFPFEIKKEEVSV